MRKKKEHPPSNISEQQNKVDKLKNVSDKFALRLNIVNGEPQIAVSSTIGVATLGAGVIFIIGRSILLKVGIVIGWLCIVFVMSYRIYSKTRNENKESDWKIEESKQNINSNQMLKEQETIWKLKYLEKQQKYQHVEKMRILDIMEKNPGNVAGLAEVLGKCSTGETADNKNEEQDIISFVQNNGKGRT